MSGIIVPLHRFPGTRQATPRCWWSMVRMQAGRIVGLVARMTGNVAYDLTIDALAPCASTSTPIGYQAAQYNDAGSAA